MHIRALICVLLTLYEAHQRGGARIRHPSSVSLESPSPNLVHKLTLDWAPHPYCGGSSAVLVFGQNKDTHITSTTLHGSGAVFLIPDLKHCYVIVFGSPSVFRRRARESE